MDSYIPKGIKRKSSRASQIKSSKRKCSGIPINIVDLSDCTLLHILKFLDATSLYQLGQTCCRFQRLVQDESLWIYVNARTAPNNFTKTEFCWQNVTKKTKHILMCGNQRSEVVLSLETLILSNQLTNLTVLALEYQCIKYCKLNEFPKTLQELSLRHSFVPGHTEFFRFAQGTMINLKTLLLDHCQWLEASSLMSLCKFPKLEILSLYMCKKLGDDDISSVSLAGRFGFTKLKVIDLRFTGLGDLFIKTFYRSTTLQIIYFQSFPSTYRIERFKRKLDLINGEKMREDGYISDDEINNDLSKESFRKRFEAKNLVWSEAQTINDDTMRVFNRLKATASQKTRPKSLLYVYPYDECTCGFFNKKLGTYGPINSAQQANKEFSEDQPNHLNPNGFKSYLSSSSDSSDDDSDDWNARTLQYKIEYEMKKQKRNTYRPRRGIFFLRPQRANVCRKLVYDSCTLPAWCQTLAVPASGHQKWLYFREPRNDYEISMLEHTDKHFQVRAIRSCGSQDPDCECGEDSCDEEDGHLIVITRNEDGSLVQLRPDAHSSPIRNEASVKQKGNEDVASLITKLSEFIIKIDQHPDNKADMVVNGILAAFDECLKKEEFSILSEDPLFVRDLWSVLSQISRKVRQNMERVLDYHFVCFQDLLKRLEKSDNITNRKHLLELFFKNLLYSESGEDRTSNQKEIKKHKTRYSYADEKWNLPGPSGMQSLSRIQDKFKSENKRTPANQSAEFRKPESKNDSDSDTNTNISKPNKSNSVKSINTEVFNDLNVLASPIYVFGDQDMVMFEKRRKLNGNHEEVPERNREVEYIEQPRDHFEPPFWPPLRNNFLIEVLALQSTRSVPTNIKELSLRGHCIGDLTLKVLKELELDLLDVTGANVTVAAVKQFMMSNPQCRLIHEFACTCRPKLHF